MTEDYTVYAHEEDVEDCPECNGEGERDYGLCHSCGGTGIVDRSPGESFYEVESIRVYPNPQ
ncbi:hypothetical protein I8752_02715 [Nostocaceae cyanobacterium CENA369]|uniref:Uncharacterized protein n=1 Tax=Dendronalium phyllosphericum CENA369 TaxID=1725256 RepID=A0A8J7LCH7_9NOST|nr:hypothetical protein [Dendronalium phyllosphericum]MBH8571961.1 hypothetical protein [Dendronalium phyllosphericum CENA369]